MTVPILDIADAVVTTINDAELSQSLTAVRQYVPKFDLHSSQAVQVIVVPAEDTREPGTAGSDSCEAMVHVGVYKKLQEPIVDEVAEIDAMLELCEEIRALMNRKRLEGVEGAVCTLIRQEPVYSVKEIDEKRVFLTVLACTFMTDVEV